jgi:hypothetical protein
VGNRPSAGVPEGHFWLRQGLLVAAKGNQVGQTGQLHRIDESVTIALGHYYVHHITFPMQ